MNISEIFKALSDENRLRIINLLIQYKSCVCEIETILGLNQANVSKHLSKLKNANLISSEKDAQWIHYRISNEFREHQRLLYDYIKEESLSINLCQQDNKRLETYLANNLTCKDIKNDINRVNKILKG